MSDDIEEFIRDMASPSDGPDLNNEELAEVLKRFQEEPERYPNDREEPMSTKKTPKMPEFYTKVTLEGYVNGCSEAREGDNRFPIVSVFIPDGWQTWGGHGPSGTTIWMSLDRFNELMGE
jgi:hypothetical protein